MHYAPSIDGGVAACGERDVEAGTYPVTCPACRTILGWNQERRYGVDSLAMMIADGIAWEGSCE